MRSLAALTVLAAVLAGCGGNSASRTPALNAVRSCLGKDEHFSVFFDGSKPEADFALGALPADVRRRSLVALVDQVGGSAQLHGSRQGVVLALLREDDHVLARRWSTYLRVHAIAGNRGGMRPDRGEAYGWVVGRIRPATQVAGTRAAWVRTWGRTQQYAYRVLLVCFGSTPPVGYPPLPKA